MPRHIDITQARELLRTREKLRAAGLTERMLRSDVVSGHLVRIHRGQYVDGAEWRDLWREGRHLIRLLAVRRASPDPGPVFSHTSAAVLWGLPLFGRVPELVHVLIEGRRHTRTLAGVARHDQRVDAPDIVEHQGLRCTSLTRTVFDLARTLRPEAAVAAADAALRQASVHGSVVNADAVAAWRSTITALAQPGLRGVRQARWMSEFADGRAQLAGESVSRLQLYRLSFRDVELQVPVVGADGARYFADFGFPRSRVFGEFDGEGKYLEAALRRTDTPIDAVLAEKRREDDIRGVTGWRFARWGSAHIHTPEALGARLAAFGIRPPG